MESETKITNNDRTIYEQDCESFRYQDKLFWSRFQTISVLEGAVAWLLLLNKVQFGAKAFISIAATLVYGLVASITIKDYWDAKNFIQRIYEFEQRANASPISPKGPNSIYFVIPLLLILFAFNIFLVFLVFSQVPFMYSIH